MNPLPSHLRRPFLLLAVLAIVFLSGVAPAATIRVALDSPADVIHPDPASNTLYRSSSGAFFDGYLTTDPEDYTTPRFYAIPQNANLVQNVVLRFRVEEFPGFASVDSITVTDGSGVYKDVTIVDSGEGFVEFTHSWEVVLVWALPQSIVIHFDANMFTDPTWARVGFQFAMPNRFDLANIDTGPIDRWYRLSANVWSETFVDGGELPESIYLDVAPVANETVEIAGEGVRFSPSSVVTDSDGLFAVAAFVDPSSFVTSKVGGPGSGSALGQLRLKYKNLISEQQISGNFCEVILVEGTVRVVEGTGTVSEGAILYPGMRLSLGASWGQKAQLGLRFVNGADASVSQDVFTNACLTDMVTIGSNGIENDSVLQGNTPLMSVSRTLCEQVAGLPNTPEEWARATGRVVVMSAASSVVSVGGITGYAIKYGIKTATGKTYDYAVNSATGGKGAIAATGLPRLDLATYYDGSARLSHNLTGNAVVIPSGDVTPLATVAAGQWWEFADSLGRQWPESPDTIDKEGPGLRFRVDYVRTSSLTILDLDAFDPAGLDPSSLSITVGGVDRTSAFQRRDDAQGHWVGEFLGNIGASVVEVALSDTLGNASTLSWSSATAPAAPEIVRAQSSPPGGSSLLSWNTPNGMAAADVLLYEVRMTGTTVADNGWYSVGSDTQAFVGIPSGFSTTTPYYLEVRAGDLGGRIGAVATSGPLTATALSEGVNVWMLW